MILEIMNVEEAFKERKNGVPLTIGGEIVRILSDDHEGIHHQRFIIKTKSGQTVLVAHNLERAYRAPIKLDDTVEIHGTYSWNSYGGIIHNTHHDDREEWEKEKDGNKICGSKHDDGWIVFVGKKSPHRTKNLPGGKFQ